MKRQADISEKDTRLLGEYLDNALSISDRAMFEKRLQSSPELTQALGELSALKKQLSSLPRKKVPHQFTLTRAEAKKARRGRFLLPTFGWASAVCSVLLVAIFGSEFIFRNFSAPQAEPAPAAYSLQMEDAQVSAVPEAKSLDNQAVYLLNWVEIGGKGGAGGAPYNNYAIAARGELGGGFVEPGEPQTMSESEEAQNVPEAVSAASQKHSVEPLIFGIREGELGQVIATQPVEVYAVSPAAEQPAVVEQVRGPMIQTNVKLILAGLAAAFALLWLTLKLKR